METDSPPPLAPESASASAAAASPYTITDDAPALAVEPNQADGVPASRLNPFFVCPQCQGYFRDPHVATCCLSTFCRDCVVRVLRTPASICPGCGHYLGVTLPQRTRPDPQLQAIMLKLLPDIFERERAREALFWRDRAAQGEELALHPDPPKDRPAAGPTTSSAFAAATAKWLPAEDRAQAAAAAAALTGSTHQEPHNDDGEGMTPLHLDLFVLCTPEQPEDGAQQQQPGRLPALPLPYLKLQRRTQVCQLREVLAGILELEEGPEALEILCQGEVLMAQHSLHFVDRTTWRNEAPPLQLHYRRRRLV